MLTLGLTLILDPVPSTYFGPPTFKKEVNEYRRHLWQREIKQGLMYSKYSALNVRNSIMKMLAPYPRKVSVNALRVLMNDFDVREVFFRSEKQN